MLGHGVDSSFSQQKLIRFAQKRQIPIITSVWRNQFWDTTIR